MSINSANLLYEFHSFHMKIGLFIIPFNELIEPYTREEILHILNDIKIDDLILLSTLFHDVTLISHFPHTIAAHFS